MQLKNILPIQIVMEINPFQIVMDKTEIRRERSRAVRAVRRQWAEDEDQENQDTSKENILKKTMTTEVTERRGRPYKVCGGRHKDRKGIVAISFEDLVEKGKDGVEYILALLIYSE